MNKIIATSLLLLMVALYAINSQKDIQLEGFYIVLPQGASNASGYGIIKNKGNDTDVLTSVNSEDAVVMLHQTQIHSGMANMAHYSEFSIKSNNSLVLKPMSYHLMLTHISKQVRDKKKPISIKFKFKKAGIIEIEMPILTGHKYD